MHSKRILLVVGATILSLAALAPAVAASPRSGDLVVTKNCSEYNFAAGGFCTITSSNLNAIKVGSRVVYSEAVDWGTLTLDSDIVIDGPGNNDAYGHVWLDLTNFEGTVTLSGGTGVFSKFAASVDVSPLGDLNFLWDDGPYTNGTYTFDPHS